MAADGCLRCEMFVSSERQSWGGGFPWQELYPFASHYHLINGHRLHYVDEPSENVLNQQEVLLMVHGNPTWSFHWRELIRFWRGRYRIVAPDHLGSGLSDKPPDLPYRLRNHIDNLMSLIERLDLNHITLMAHDWGGAIGLGTVLEMPRRFVRFVLFNTGAFRPWFIPWPIRLARTPVLGRVAIQGLNLFARSALRLAVVHRDRLTRAVKAGYLAPYGSWAQRRGIYQFVQDIPASPSHPTYKTLVDIEKRLPQLAGYPCQLIWGMQDWCFTAEILEKFLELWPGAEAHRLHDAGHWVVEDAWEQVIDLVEPFLVSGGEGTKRQMGFEEPHHGA